MTCRAKEFQRDRILPGSRGAIGAARRPKARGSVRAHLQTVGGSGMVRRPWVPEGSSAESVTYPIAGERRSVREGVGGLSLASSGRDRRPPLSVRPW